MPTRLEMADRHVLFKQAVKDYATQHGYTATFMPRPMTDDLGSSCHIHTSLRDDKGAPVFHDAGDERGVSDVLRHAVGGCAGARGGVDVLVCAEHQLLPPHRQPGLRGQRPHLGLRQSHGEHARAQRRRAVGDAIRVPPSRCRCQPIPRAGRGARVRRRRRRDACSIPGRRVPATRTRAATPACHPLCLPRRESFLRSEFAATAFGADVLKHYHALAEYEWHTFMRSVTDWERERYLDSI